MSTQRTRLALSLTAASALLCAFFASTVPAGTRAQDGSEPIELKIATVAPEGTPWEKQLRTLKRHIETESAGRIKVRLFMGGSLGGEKALVRRTASGSIQCFAGSTAALGSIVEAMNVIEAPYLFDSAADADRVLDGAARPLVESALRGGGFRFALWAENGFRSWFTRSRPISRPSDLNGLRMRSQEASVHLSTYRAFGATPVPIDVTNVLTSLQTDVVDGFDNTPLFAFATSWYQAVSHLTLSEHSYQPGIMVYSSTWFDGLPADLQTMLTSLPASLTAEGRSSVRRMDPVLISNLERAGITVRRLSASERAAFAAIGRPVQDAAAAEAGAAGRSLLSALRGD
jgi:TRAP-type C4-dicarboxylate transport system substrate-binding protein